MVDFSKVPEGLTPELANWFKEHKITNFTNFKAKLESLVALRGKSFTCECGCKMYRIEDGQMKCVNCHGLS